MSEVDQNKKEENENENKEGEHKKKKKKKKKKAEATEEKVEKGDNEEKQEKKEKEEEGNNSEKGYNKDIIRNNIANDEDIKQLNQEALSNIPSKEVPKKKKKKKKKSEEENQNKQDTKEKEENEEIKENEKIKENEEKKEIKDNLETKEIDINEILNNNSNNNNGDLMITELLDVEGKKKKKKKHKKEKNNPENENIKEEVNEGNVLKEEEKPINEKNIYLKDKFDSLPASESLKTGINQGIIKSNEEIHEDIKNDKLSINNKKLQSKELSNLNKSLEDILAGSKKVFLTDVSKYMAKDKIKNYKFLKNEEELIKKKFEKLDQNQKLIENALPLESNVIDSNIRKSKLKDISRAKDDLILRLEKISQKVDILLSDEKMRHKNIRQNLTEILEDEDDDFISRLAEIQKNENKIRKIYQKDLQKAINKRNQELDIKENNIKELKKKLFNEAREKEKELFLKRKNEINKKLEKTKKYINEKMQKTEKDYLYFKYQENYDRKEKKLYDKVNMTKKEPLVTQEQLKELKEKINQQRKYLIESAEEKKKQMQKLWTYRSQTLPAYRNPLIVKIEEDKIKKLNDEEEEKKKKECNQLEKNNYKPPSVKINKKLKSIREKRINLSNKDMVIETEINNKKRLNAIAFAPIKTNKNPIIKDEKSIELNNNNYIDFTEVQKSMIQKSKNKLKPIQILHPRPEKPIDYLKEMKEKRNMSIDIEKKKSINFDDLFNKNSKNDNIIESLEVAKIRTESIDKKVERKKEIMKTNGGYLKNPYLAGEIGDLLVESIQVKLKLMNKLGGGENEE